ncbi:hypothetical protein, partial [uncultured Ruminococcus sp.]|uniref:hypothetical protein n=1 Tax=uncultured Ruminococcus sp. TaxID=165186 RepID=UPI00294392A3
PGTMFRVPGSTSLPERKKFVDTPKASPHKKYFSHQSISVWREKIFFRKNIFPILRLFPILSVKLQSFSYILL